MKFLTYLLLRETAAESLRTITRDLHHQELDLTARPVLKLRVGTADDASVVVLLRRKEDEGMLRHTLRNRRSLKALATAPTQVLRKFHGKRFLLASSYVEFKANLPEDAPALAEPYYRRFIEIKYLTAGGLDTTGTAVEDLSGSMEREDGSEVRSHATEGAYDLFLEPIRLEIDAAEAQRLLANNAALLERENGLFLPPVRLEGDEAAYFSNKLVDMRWTLARSCKLNDRFENEPACIGLWRASNDPFLRDFLLDGGELRLSDVDGKAVSELVCDGEQGPENPETKFHRAYRQRMCRTRETPGPSWSRMVADALWSDLRSIVQRVTVSGQEVKTAHWSIERLRGYEKRLQAGGPGTDDTWESIRGIGSHVWTGQDHKYQFEERVAKPSRPRPDVPPDNDLAEVCFQHFFWRCPSSASEDSGPWRRAFVRLLSEDFQGHRQNPEDRCVVESSEGGFQATAGEHGSLNVKLSAVRKRTDLRFLQLMFPLGTRFSGDEVFILEDPVAGRLDQSFVLG